MAAINVTQPHLVLGESSDDVAQWEGELGLDGLNRSKSPSEDHSAEDYFTPNKAGRPSVVLSRSSGGGASLISTTNSDEDYDALTIDPSTVVQGGKGGGLQAEATLNRPLRGPLDLGSFDGISITGPESRSTQDPESRGREHHRRKSIPITLQKTGTKGKYLLSADDPEIKEILRRGIEGQNKKRRSRFGDLVFTRQFTTFDRQNPASASPFHGFFTLFWLGLFLMLVKVAANNWKVYGSVLGRNELLALMFSRDVFMLGITDGIMCASTIFGLFLQKFVLAGYLNWNTSGWIIQHLWQTLYLTAIISWTLYRSWPWSHTIFIVLHCFVMLMKQHSYAAYNGHLSKVYKIKKVHEERLRQLEELEEDVARVASPPSPTTIRSYRSEPSLGQVRRRRQSHNSPEEQTETAKVAAALESEAPLNREQIHTFKRIIQREIDILDEELKGKCSSTTNIYPHNLNIRDFAQYLPLPTVVYELEYPRQDHIDWYYVAEKTAATFGVLFVMHVISQAYIYPIVVTAVNMKEQGMTLRKRLEEFPWLLSDLLFPLMMEYLLSWYVIWECILNVLAEVTLFADRGFYADWWNSTSWDQYARDWNRPVHNFLLRHVYHSSISAFKLSRPAATLVTFLLSACVHELVMWCLFKKLRGYLMGMQMMQLPLVALSRTKWLKDRKILGNLVFWIGIFTGPSFLCSLYLII